MSPVDLIVTRHASLVDYLRELGLATDATPVIKHVADAAVLDGKRVAGVLPLHLAARCAAVVEVPINHTPETRARWSKNDGGLDELRLLAGAPVEYVCRTAQAYAVALRDAANGGFHEGAALAESR